MRGRVLAFDFKTGQGQISGEDGQRYTFAATAWNGDRHPTPGDIADFQAQGGIATDIFRIGGTSSGFGGASAGTNRTTAALLAIFLGGWGVHKFYMGKTTSGVIMLAVWFFGIFIFLIPSFIIWIIAVVEFIIYISMTDADFDQKYVQGHQEWF